MMDFGKISLLVLDVDGVLTDGGIVFVDGGTLIKAFHVHDGSALKRWRAAGHELAIISGRRAEAVTRRAEELGITCVHQGCGEKLGVYEQVLESCGRMDEAVCYVGDDRPDLPPMRRCAFPVAVANAIPAVKQAAAYVTRHPGGGGAVAEVVELLLRKQSGRVRSADRRTG